jgi:DNA-binding response OmpR family regulator
VKTVLIVDDDLGFLLWISDALAVAEMQAIPAQNVQEADRLIRSLRATVDLLIVNPALAGVAEYAQSLRRVQGHLRVLALIEETEDSHVVLPGVNAVRSRPEVVDDCVKSEWLDAIRDVLVSGKT